MPLPGDAPQALRFGVAGCQHYEEGYYAAFRHLAREDLAFVYHYGDYIYEYGGDRVRPSFGGDLIVPVRQYEGRMLYDITDYQDVLYVAESFSQVEDVVGGFWADCTDDSITAILARTPAHA